jgi:hypothetical protein
VSFIKTNYVISYYVAEKRACLHCRTNHVSHREQPVSIIKTNPITVRRSSGKICYFCPILTNIWMRRQIFVTVQNKKPDENPFGWSSDVPCGQRVGRTSMTRPIVVSRKCFEIAPKNLKILSLCFHTALCASCESLSHSWSFPSVLKIDSHPSSALRCSFFTSLSTVA